MKEVDRNELKYVSGGRELTNAEATNAYMMAGSMFFPILGLATYRSYFPLINSLSVIGAFTEATIVGGGTGIGVWVGYQVYYLIYDE